MPYMFYRINPIEKTFAFLNLKKLKFKHCTKIQLSLIGFDRPDIKGETKARELNPFITFDSTNKLQIVLGAVSMEVGRS